MKKITFITILILCVNYLSQAQDKTEYTDQTFHSNRVINGQSVDLIPAGVLDFNLAHRMGRINQGFDNFFGIDQATSRLGLDYGITDWLMTGIGRSTTDKLVDGFIKIKILRQCSGEKNMPFSLTYFSSMAVNTLAFSSSDTLEKNLFSNRLYYTHQLIIARKFSKAFSFQIAPTLIHRNIVDAKKDKNDVLSIGLAGRLKISNRIDLTAEYFYVLPKQIVSQYASTDVVNSASIGIDIYTGKHTFQVFITNATTMAEKAFITETTERWDKGNIHIGFNILRLFTIVNK
jgi:hypothetical protein